MTSIPKNLEKDRLLRTVGPENLEKKKQKKKRNGVQETLR